MYKDKTFLAIVPARGGSKRLPRKNVLDLAGKPLIAWSIEAGLKSKYIDDVVVSSDNEEILQISKNLAARTIKRPDVLASDTATTFDVIKHTIENFEKYDYIVLLQPTSPLRDENHIDEAIELLESKNADAVISVCEVEHPIQWSMSLPAGDDMSEFVKNIDTRRAQEQEKHYRLNGAVYICNTEAFLQEKSFFLKKNIVAYKMSRESSVDIDEELDFKIAEILINKKIQEI